MSLYRDYHNDKVFLLPTAETAAGMGRALSALAPFACRLGAGETIGPADQEGYLPRGIRRLERTDRPGFERAVDLLLAKVEGRPFVTEVPMEVWDKVEPAPPLRDAAGLSWPLCLPAAWFPGAIRMASKLIATAIGANTILPN